MGTLNLHASLLPQYRGAAPIQWVIINGEKETGLTTFFLKHEIDTGSIIFQEREPILGNDTAGDLYERLMKKGCQLVLKTVKAIATGSYPSLPQLPSGNLKHAPKIHKDICEINWNQSSTPIQNFIRGLCPYPTAWTQINGKTFKIFHIQLAPSGIEDASQTPGSLKTNHKTYLYIKASDGWISIEELQPEGKRKMTIGEFFRGNKILI